MTLDQAIVFVLLVGVLVLLVWNRIRYDLVALAALLAGVATGVVEPDAAFLGFSNDIVIIVGSALVVSAAVARSGLAEAMVRPFARRLTTSELQVVFLVFVVAALSAFMKNIGALAIFMPIAFQMSRRSGKPVSRLLMPMSFGALLGGLTTLIGTSPNVIVSQMRAELLDRPFGMFDFMPVGLPLAVAGIVFLVFGWRLLPRSRKPAPGPEDLFSVGDYHTEVLLPAGSPFVEKTVRDLEAAGEGEVTVAAIVREKYRRYVPAGNWTLYEGDILVLQCDAHALARIVQTAKLELMHDKDGPETEKRRDDALLEAVISPGSPMIGNTVEGLRLRDSHGMNLLALSRSGSPVTARLRRVRFQAGDLVLLRATQNEIGERLAALGCLPLAGRRLHLGGSRRGYLAVGVLAAAMAVAATGVVPVAVAFFAAAVLVVLCGALPLREAYEKVEWPILILLGALIPVSEALRTTGGTDLIAGWLSAAAHSLPPVGALGLMMVAAMAVTPFLNNAATVLVMAPIGVSFAARLDLNPDAFLMAVAVGAACDFLTPIGHQCNTLVMGPGGYRFSDYPRLGLPLSLIVVALGTPLIAWVWPLA